MDFPNINPNAFEIFGIAIKWYGLAYAIGLITGLWNCKRVISAIPGNANKKNIDSLLIWVALGTIIGGRFGYVFFYNLDLYILDPITIITGIRKGGMSFHGGLIGVIFFTLLYSKIYKLNFLQIMDSIACSAPIGIFLGRLANFINAELWGKTTSSSWGIIFPEAGLIPRHPSQLYEAFLEGILLFLIVNYMVYKNIFKKAGAISGSFLLLYGFFRIFSEIFREPDAHLGQIIGFLSMGTILSIPMIFMGLVMIVRYK